MADSYTVLGCGRSARGYDFPEGVYWVQASVAKSDGAAAIPSAAKKLGRVALLVKNAGVQVEKTTADSTGADWDLVIGAN